MARLPIGRTWRQRCYSFTLDSATLLLFGTSSAAFSAANWLAGTLAFVSVLLLMRVQES